MERTGIELVRAALAQISRETIETEKPFKVQVTVDGRRYEVGAPEIYIDPETGAWAKSAAWIARAGGSR